MVFPPQGTRFKVKTEDIDDEAVTTAKIADGTIKNADISDTAAIEEKKLKELALLTNLIV